MSHFHRVLLLSVSSLLGGCSQGFSFEDLFFVEVEEKRICKQLGEQSMPAAQPGVREMDTVIPFSTLPSDVGGESVGEFSFRVTELVLETGDSSQLDLLEEAMLVMRPEGVTDPAQARTLLSYQRQSSTQGQPLRLQGDEVELTELLASGPMELVLRAKGELPEQPWTLRVGACWGMRIRVNYLRAYFSS